ncbi:MAG: hypothetical protein GY859_06475 [Desulfobacterales bacterium]|nr:hypothetical protein [Desulfobacterales bacterium]
MKKTKSIQTPGGHLAATGLILSILLGLLVLGAPVSTEARITRVEFTTVESPAFEGASFGKVGQYDKLVGKAYGEVDPNNPLNSIIQDIGLAPRNERGMVEYSMDVYILKPSDMLRGNNTLFYEVVNRGQKIAMFAKYHQDAAFSWDPTFEELGDALLLKRGYTLVWSGWQGDMKPEPNKMLMTVPIASNPDGSSITGDITTELAVRVESTTISLSAGFLSSVSGTTSKSYAPVSLDNETPLPDGFLPTQTVRSLEWDPREQIPNDQWDFGSCPDGENLTPNDSEICLYGGFQPGKIYELIYKAKDPLVLGLGFAGIRDVVSFLKRGTEDDEGAPNPLAMRPGMSGPRYALLSGTSQAGRLVRTYLNLGFNEIEDGGARAPAGERRKGASTRVRQDPGRIVFDGATAHLATAGHMALNMRFGQPTRGTGQHFEHTYPTAEFPLSYSSTTDPYTGRTASIFDRCTLSNTCPKLFHNGTAAEIYEGRDSLARTDPLGRFDLPEHPLVRTYIMASTQHAPGFPPFFPCKYESNPAPFKEAERALLKALLKWVKRNRTPPPSQAPMISDGTLVTPEAVDFPTIPANNYGGVSRPAFTYLALVNPLTALDLGPFFFRGDMSGVTTVHPPRLIPGADYKVLVPQVDEDGHDLAGIRSTALLAPIGTHTGWNLGAEGWFEDQLCSFHGSFIPFATTMEERMAVGDPRLSLEERYGDHDGYVAAVRAAAEHLVYERFLLRRDAQRLIAEAEASDVLAP